MTPPPPLQLCPNCDESKPASEYPSPRFNSRLSPARRGFCRECVLASIHVSAMLYKARHEARANP